MNFNIFLLPQGEIMATAMVENDKIKILRKTLFPSGNKYSISKSGIAVCLDKDKKVIIYGQLLINGSFGFYKLIDFPEMISPKSICILDEHLILGGENYSRFNEKIVSHELVVTYNILNGKFTSLEMPYKGHGKCVDDLLIDNDKIIAVDNIVYPKYLLEYNFKNPYNPYLDISYELPTNGTYETIKKGVLSEAFIVLTSSSLGEDGVGAYINIFKRGDYKLYIRLSQWYGWGTDREKKYTWSDTIIINNYLCISALDDGIGLFLITGFEKKPTDKSGEIQYFNPWGKRIIKIITIPNNIEKLIFIMSSNNLNCYEIVSKEEIINLYSNNKSNRKNADIFGENKRKRFHSNESNDIERDYFNTMTDGQLGNYDNFEGNIDDIDDWAGR